MKKTKFAMLLVMVLVFALQSVGMMPAGAEGTSALALEDLTADALFEGLGDALNYGVVAEEYTQLNHAETSICVDTLYKNHADPFMNTDKTFEYGSSYTLYASVSAPADKSLKDMEFALFYMDGEDYVMFEDTLCKVSDDANTTVLEWDITKDSPCLKKEVSVRQVELIGGNYVLVPENGTNKKDLTVKYGPDVSTAAPSSSYIGEVVSNQSPQDAGKFFNTATPTGIEFGPGVRLVIEDGEGFNRWKDVTDCTYKYVDKSGNSWGATVYFEYKDQLGLTRRTQFTDMRIYYEYDDVNGGYFYQVFEDGGEEYPVNFKKSDFVGETDENGKVKGRAQTLLEQAADFSVQLANLGGGTSVTNDINQDPSLMGNSTVTAGLDAKGRVVSVYSATITDNKIDFDASSDVLDTQIHIAENEYVVVNVVIDPDVSTVTLSAPPSPPYIIAAGAADKATWYDGPDSGCSDRVLYNYVTKDADGDFQPYTGKITNMTQYYGGTMLAPGADIEVKENVVNGALIGKTVVNNGQELHQRTMTRPSQTTTVYMFGKYISENGALQLTKRNGSTKELLAGVTFGVFESESSEQPLVTGITDENGYLIINDLTPGKYCVKEISAPEGYDVSKAQVFKNVEIIAGVTTVLGLDNGGYVDNIKGYGQLKIVKVDADDTSKMLEGAEFEIYYYDGDAFNADEAILVGTHSTNKNGVIEAPLDAGTYWVMEVRAPYRYMLTDGVPVKAVIESGNTTLLGETGIVTNEKAPTGTLVFTKVDAENHEKKLKAKFGIYADAKCEMLLETFMTGDDGSADLEMPVGTYYVQEIEAPEKYQLDDTIHTVVIEEGQPTKIGTDGVVTNDYLTRQVKVGKVRIERVWHSPYNYEDVPYGLPGAWFAVYKDAACTQMVGAPQVTGEDGYAYFTLRIEETYYVKEIAAPKGYVLSDVAAKEFQLWQGEGIQKIEFSGNNVYNGHSGGFYGALINNKARETGRLMLYKATWDLVPGEDRGNKPVTTIDGAEFGVYYDKECTMAIEGSPFTTGSEHGAKGRKGFIEVDGLTPGTYYVREEKAAPGYQKDDQVMEVNVAHKPGNGETRVQWKDSTGKEHGIVYNAVDNAVSATLDVTKYLDTGSYSALVKETFNFAMTFKSAKDAAGADKTTGYTINDGEEAIAFAGNSSEKAKDAFKVSFTEPGVYTFEVKEIAGDNTDYIVYDKSVYTVVYNVTEQDGALSVQESISKGEATVLAVSFTNTYGEFNIEGKKVWSGADESYRLQVDKFAEKYLVLSTVDADGKLTKVTDYDIINSEGTADGAYLSVFMDSDGHFYWSFRHLPAYDADGNALTYVVKELTVNGYQTFYVNQSGEFEDETDGLYVKAPRPASTEYALAIHNILADATLRIDKTVEVQGNAQPDMLPEFQFTITPAEGLTGYHFVDAQGKELASPVTIAVEKKADGKISGTLPVTILFDSFEGTEKKFTFIVEETGTAPAGWTYDASEKTVTFTVMRNQSAFEPSDSPTMSQPVIVAMDSTSGGTASFTNTYKEEEKTSVTVKKVWHTAGGEIAPAEKQYDVTEFLDLYVLTTDSDGNEKLTLVKDADGKVLRPVQQPLLKGEGTYDYTWSDLPKLKDGEQYVVKEDLEALYAKHPGYYANYDYNRDDYANAEEGYLVSNHVFRADVELAARKLVDGKMPELAKRFSFVVKNLTTNEEHIFKNEDLFVGEDNSLIDVFIVYGPEVQPAPGKTTVYEYVMYEDDLSNGVYIYDKAQFKFQATIDINGNTTIKVWNEEKQAYVDDLAINAPAFTFNNKTATPVVITKFWMDENGYVKAENAPNIADKLILCKLVNGEPKPVENAELPEYTFGEGELGGVYTWSDLPKYDENGNAIEYVVVEQKMPGYEQYYFGADGRLIDGGTYAPNGGAIENGWQTTDVIITKVWVGGPLVDSDISNDLALYANGEHVNEAPEKDGNRYAWYDLPKYDENGKLITYTVKESGIPGYVVSYEPMYIGEDADQEVAKDFAFAGETITNTYYETEGKVEFDGVKVLNGRDMKAGEFTFILTDVHGNKLQRVTNAVDGSFTFDAIEFTTEDVPYGESLPAIYRIYEADGDLPGMTYDPTEYVIELLLTDNKAGKIVVEPVGGSLPEIKFVNTYEEKVYEAKGEVEFDGVKVLNGRDMKAGEFTFILTDKAGKELQRVTNAADGTFAFEPIKYTEKDVPYGKDAEFTYYITELAGNLPGVTYDTTKYEIVVGLWDDAKGTIHVGDISECVNEIVFTNTYEAEGSVTFKGAKFLLGREFKQGDEFTFELLNEKGDVIDTVTINPTSGAKADFTFKTIKYELADAGKTYTYTYRVKEKAGAEEGMTYDDTVHTVTVKVSDAGNGTLKVEASKNADALNFTNTYLAEGTVLFSGTKTMNGKALEGKDFTFVLTDADGKEIETVTNDKDGKIVFSAIQYKLEDAGKTFTYKVSEKNDGKKSVTYDDTVYTVTVKVEDAGNGHLKVTASDNATKLNFTNSYEAKAVLTMNAYKTVNGYKPSVNQVYDFVLLCDDGTEMKAQNKDEVITFGTIGFDEEDVGKTFIYTVKETTEANELLEVDAAIYQVAVTVVDNGDGNLKLETEILKDGKRANGVVFANTATATLAISKTVKGPGPDKAFDLKVTFIGVDGKELEGVYDYDGDVKGTITSGGVIALKDGQSVTIVGLPEGATYTVEENAGPAYTVTVNGKPIAKAEGTLVGHGKLEFINTVEVTTFSVTKVWEGTDLGEITLTLYADGKQITPQPEVTREGDKYTYYNLPKYNEEGEEIVYSAKERGIDGYIRIYNNVEPYQDVTSSVHDGGTIINREIQEEVHELSFKIHKVWTGVEATEEIPAITLTLYCNGEKLDVPTPKPDSEGWYRYYDLPKTVNGQIAVYTVVEAPIPGYTVTYKTASGEVVEEGVNGGEIINAKIPQTGDPATLGLWLALMGASAVLLTMLQRRRKA